MRRTCPKLSSPLDFSEKRYNSCAFLNFCSLYIYLALEQFHDEEEKILWALTFFKSGHIAKWSENVFCQEADTCKEAKLQAGIKPTALCSAIDKENSIEFPLDFLYYLYNYYMVCVLFSHTYHVTHHVTSCDVML